MKLIRESKKNVSLVFKDFEAQFLKRAEGDVEFICEEGDRIKELVSRTLASGERESEIIAVKAYVPGGSIEGPVAEFKLTLSLKKR